MASTSRLHGLADSNREISISSLWTLPAATCCNLPVARDETKIRTGLPTASIWCSRPSAAGQRRSTPCWQTAADCNSLQRKGTTKNLFGVRQHNKKIKESRRGDCQDER